MSGSIDYGNLMHDAMRGLIRKVLRDVSENGLPGAHHFFITFDTEHPDAELADWLSDRYPEEMTVVMQHWFENLEVNEDGFSVTVNFGDQPEPLYIPYDAIKTFVDPSVEFGMRFETQTSDDQEKPAKPSKSPTVLPAMKPASSPSKPEQAAKADTSDKGESPANPDPASKSAKDAEIVSLDSFRK